jgi:uncharacterized protein (TIGR02118 family)
VVKLVFLCRRRPGIAHDRYATWLLEGHVPLALRHHPTMRGYVVNVVEANPPGGPELDSIGELVFDTLADYRERLYDSPAGERAIARDVAGFLGGADAYVTTEHVQRSGPAAPLGARTPGVKLVCPLVRRAGMSHEAFVAHWLERHVPLALRHHPALTRYVTNVVDARLSSTGLELDGIAELHFASAAALRDGMFDSPDGERAVREDIARFIGWTAPYRVAEYVQKRP